MLKSRYRFVILHQYSPDAIFKPGIESFINDLIENAVFPINSLLLGTRNTEDDSLQNRWQRGDIDGRYVASDKPVLIPVSLRLFILSAVSLLRIQPRVIYVCRYDYVLPVKILCPFSRVILSIHTDGSKLLSEESDSSWTRMRLLAKIFERLAFRLSSVVFCHSKTEFCRWSDLYKNKLHYIPASYESKNFYLEDGERDLVIWAGRFETVKNPVFANRVLTSLKIPGIKASMYGSGSLFAEVERANKISGNPITINAAVSSEDLGKILRRTKVLISTSHFEGAPRILVEALASGARIVCLSSADPHDYASEFPNDCIHQEQVEVESMVKKIESLIQREHLAHVNIEHYSNTRVFGILRRIFHEQLD